MEDHPYTDLSDHEPIRLVTLEEYEILDTSQEKELNDLTEKAAELCGTPIALISLVASERQWFATKIGLELSENPRFISFYGHPLNSQGVVEIKDALLDDHFRSNPLVMGNPNIRFYAAAPLVTPFGDHVGTLCVIDTKPNELTDYQRNGLKGLAQQAMVFLNLKRTKAEQRKVEDSLTLAYDRLEAIKAILGQPD